MTMKQRKQEAVTHRGDGTKTEEISPHPPITYLMFCKALTSTGEPCQARPMQGDEYCYLHNPAISEEEKRDARSRGGKENQIIIKTPLPPLKLTNPKDVIALLEDTINAVRGGEMDVKIANCLGFLTDKLLKAYEVGELSDKVEVMGLFLEKRKGR